MKSIRFWVRTGALTTLALSFAGCQVVAPLFGSPETKGIQGASEKAAANSTALGIDFRKELVITDLSVVEDPQRTTGKGPWTFAYLIEQMANGRDTDRFVRDWLETWMRDQTLNGDNVLARQKIKELILDPWPKRSDGRLDLEQAPFRLLAITNRLDVRREGNIGEGRFVFGVIDRHAVPPSAEAVPFTVIFEYGITMEMGNPSYKVGQGKADKDQQRVDAIKKWAQQWHNLGKVPYGPGFNAQLQRITDTFAKAGADRSKPNGSALNQLRTNEIQLGLMEAFSPEGVPQLPLNQIKPWEMREFHVGPSGQLVPVPVAVTPKLALNNSSDLATFINQNEEAILQDRHVMPASMLAGVSLVPGAFDIPGVNSDPPIVWNAPGITNPEARFKFAQNTCSGCHLIESGFEKDGGAFVPGKAFLHVRPRLAGQESELSPFLRGVSVPDPVSGISRDLNDMDRRVDDLQVVLGMKQTSRYYDAKKYFQAPFPAKPH